MTAQLINGKEIAKDIRAQLSKEVAELSQAGRGPHLHAIQIGSNPGSDVYIRAQRKAAEKIGLDYTLHQLEKDTTKDQAMGFIGELNEDAGVTGLILQMPVPPQLDAHELQELIAPHKDAEGVSPTNMGQVVYGSASIAPCTAMAIMELISSTGVQLYGKEAVMVGHSDIVGKPTALFLLDKFVTTSVCHIATGERGSLERFVRGAEILIAAVGKANLIRGEWVQEGAIVIDVGINRVEGSIVGDVEFGTAQQRAAWITPVPGGVGPVTTAMLLRNVLQAAKLQQEMT